MPSKRSQHELKRLIEQAAATVWRLPRPGLWFCVDEVEAHGHPPDSLEVWATLHFLPAGSPFCCGEPMCHLGLGEEICSQIGDEVRRMMGLRHQIGLTFAGLAANYHPGVEFHYGQVDD
ncbi:MAG TPA: hypothetical protein VHB77_16825 [Planctomycetaceae bacterium]|nr:hypothetical protein [Planctomycetaceae bacterium]